MIIRLLPTYIYLFMEAQNAQPFHSNTKVKLLILNNFEESQESQEIRFFKIIPRPFKWTNIIFVIFTKRWLCRTLIYIYLQFILEKNISNISSYRCTFSFSNTLLLLRNHSSCFEKGVFDLEALNSCHKGKEPTIQNAQI